MIRQNSSIIHKDMVNQLKNISIKDIEELKQKLKKKLDKEDEVESIKPMKEQIL